MSNYFRALQRLQKSAPLPPPEEEPGAPELFLRSSETPVDQASHQLPVEPEPTHRRDSEPVSRRAGYAYRQVLDFARAQSSGSGLPLVSIAAVTDAEPIGGVVNGVTTQANRLGLSFQLLDLVATNEGRFLRSRLAGGSPGAGGQDPETVSSMMRFAADTDAQSLKDWFERVGLGGDLLLLIAPPLLDSVDGALVGREGQGLILIAEAGVTGRSELKEAVELVRTAGCELLGVVLLGSAKPIPRALKGLLSLFG